ncbi:MAG: ABC transporter substrate-binding protein [Eubacteriales bacterium]|nr:ABC transporter substrate-binding protein [Eubacteriales bacterium]
MKKFFAILLSAAMVLGLVACSQPATQTPATEAPKATEAATQAAATTAAATEAAPADEHTPVTLQVSIVESDFLEMWTDTIKPKFEAEYPWITLEDVGTGESKTEFHSTRAAANDLPPVMQTDNGDTYYALVDAGKIIDLSGTEAAKNIPQSYKDAYTYNGVLFGLTQGAAYDAMFFNMSILNAAGVEAAPTNWDEFIAACEKVKAAGYEVLCYAGAKTTTAWMTFESIIVNIVGPQLGEGQYEELMRSGKINLNDYPEIAERMAALVPFIATGSSTMTEDDVTAFMNDGNCAMAIAGNWTSSNIVKAIGEATGDESNCVMTPPPFNNAGQPCWLAATPESSFGMSEVDDPAIKEARDIFFEWIFKAENFRYIQNARGTCPVLTTITEDQIVLPDATKAFVVMTGSCTPFSMSFNNVKSDVNKNVTAIINEIYTSNKDAKTGLDEISALIAADPKNG